VCFDLASLTRRHGVGEDESFRDEADGIAMALFPLGKWRRGVGYVGRNERDYECDEGCLGACC